jgi:hypothetical protein
METTPEGAFLTFGGWKENGNELLCQSHVAGWACVFKGRVESLSRDEVLIVSGDGLTRLWFSFRTEDLGFSFGLNDDVVPEGALIVALPLRFRSSELADPSFVPRREKLSFLALPASTHV